MQWLKVILITLMVVSVPIKATASTRNPFDKPLDKPPITFESEEVKEGKNRYTESKAILAKIYPLLEQINEVVVDLEEMIFEKNEKDKDFYPMLVTTHEIRDILYLLDHSVTMSISLIHIKDKNYHLFLKYSYNRVDKLMRLINFGKTMINVNLNFIDNENFIEKSKKALELVTKLQKMEADFFERLML